MKLARRVLGSVLLVGAVFSADASAQVRSMDALVSLRSVDQPLTDIVKFLRDRSGANIVVIPAEDGTVPEVSLELTEVPWRDALRNPNRCGRRRRRTNHRGSDQGNERRRRWRSCSCLSVGGASRAAHGLLL